MPYIHFVALKFKPTASEASIAEIFAFLKTFQTFLPGLLEYSFGLYESPEGLNKGFTHAFTMKFADKAARDSYFPHPQHEVVKNMIIAAIDDVMCFDYEM